MANSLSTLHFILLIYTFSSFPAYLDTEEFSRNRINLKILLRLVARLIISYTSWGWARKVSGLEAGF